MAKINNKGNLNQIWIVGLALLIALFLAQKFFIPHLINQRKKAVRKAKAWELNAVIPNFAHLYSFVTEGKGEDTGHLKDYVRYYKKVIENFPHIAEAYGALGYCYYYLGEENKSLDSFKKASEINPSFFWFHYNLGVTYYQKQDYVKALSSLQKAFSTDPKITIKILVSSKVYQQIMGGVEGFDYPLAENLKNAYFNTNRLLSLTYFQLGKIAYNDKRYETAFALFQESIRREQNFAEAVHYLGLSLESLGKEELAKEAYSKEQALGPDGGVNADKIQIQFF